MKINGDASEAQAFPLTWPIGRPRTPQHERRRAAFQHYGKPVPVSVAVDRLVRELERFKADDVVISTNVRPTLSGVPSRETATDPGAACYFRLRKVAHCISCDRWDRLADNIAAAAAHVESIRGQLRWGCVDVAEAFRGVLALAAIDARPPWWQVLGFKARPTLDQLEAKRLQLVQQHHPDRGGHGNQMAEILAAADEGRRELAR